MSDWGSFMKGFSQGPSLSELVMYAITNRDQRHARLKAEDEAKTKEEEAKAEKDRQDALLRDYIMSGLLPPAPTQNINPADLEMMQGAPYGEYSMPSGGLGTGIRQAPGPDLTAEGQGIVKAGQGGMDPYLMMQLIGQIPGGRTGLIEQPPEPKKEDVLEKGQLDILYAILAEPLRGEYDPQTERMISGATKMPDWRAQLESYNMDPSDFETEYNYIRDNPHQLGEMVNPPQEFDLGTSVSASTQGWINDRGEYTPNPNYQQDMPDYQFREFGDTGLIFDPATGATVPIMTKPSTEMTDVDNIGGIGLYTQTDGGVSAQSTQMNKGLLDALYSISPLLKKLGITGIQHVGTYNDREARDEYGNPLGYQSTHAQALAMDVKGFYDGSGQYHPVSDTNDPLVQSVREIVEQFPNFVDEPSIGVWHVGLGRSGQKPQIETGEDEGPEMKDVAIWWGGLTTQEQLDWGKKYGEMSIDPPDNVKKYAYEEMMKISLGLPENVQLELKQNVGTMINSGLKISEMYAEIDAALEAEEITQQEYDYLKSVIDMF